MTLGKSTAAMSGHGTNDECQLVSRMIKQARCRRFDASTRNVSGSTETTAHVLSTGNLSTQLPNILNQQSKLKRMPRKLLQL
jgi:hypothetical protein